MVGARRRLLLLVTAVWVAASACTVQGGPDEAPAGRSGAASGPATEQPGRPDPSLDPGFLLASSFEQPVCGVWWRPDPGCEFGVEGDVVSGEFSCRTGPNCLKLQRMNREIHVAVIGKAPAPGGRAFIGVAHRIPEFPPGVLPERRGYLELEQLNPTDGSIPGWAVEVRIYPDRRLGLGLSQVDVRPEDDFVLTDWRAPVDEWFYVVVGIANGAPATQRMWVYGSGDRLVERVSIDLTTRIEWVHENRAAQKIGGSASTELPFVTFVDDWYVATEFFGPLHIDANGRPIEP